MNDSVKQLRDLVSALSEQHRLDAEYLEIMRRALAEAEALAEREGISAGRSRREVLPDDGDPASLGFVVPWSDDVTGEPIYETDVVRGRGTMRERAYAAATVYGRRLREVALATAIHATGETSAPDERSTRWSLGSVVRYSDAWVRDKGYLVYLKGLQPDVELISKLYRESGRDEYLSALQVAAPELAAEELDLLEHEGEMERRAYEAEWHRP